jgi:hypothetical protein
VWLRIDKVSKICSVTYLWDYFDSREIQTTNSQDANLLKFAQRNCFPTKMQSILKIKREKFCQMHFLIIIYIYYCFVQIEQVGLHGSTPISTYLSDVTFLMSYVVHILHFRNSQQSLY